MKKWLIVLMGLTLAVAVAATTVALAVGGGEADEPPADQPPIRSDEDIDPNECNWVHNITACEGEPEPSGSCAEDAPHCKDTLDPRPDVGEPYSPSTTDGPKGPAPTPVQEPGEEPPAQVEPLPPIRSDEGIDPNECNWVHNITACDDEEPPTTPLAETGVEL